MEADKSDAHVPHRRAAREAIAEAGRGAFPMGNYVVAARQLPALLQRHGLGQALAYLQTRSTGQGTSPYDLLVRQLDRWLLTVLGVSGRSALAALAARDSRFYREASEQAWLFVRALREGLEKGS
jgi:hypothetical protein